MKWRERGAGPVGRNKTRQITFSAYELVQALYNLDPERFHKIGLFQGEANINLVVNEDAGVTIEANERRSRRK